MPILNYTTSIKTEKTAAEIHQKLIRASACSVISEYDDSGILISIKFEIRDANKILRFKLPINIDGVHNALKNNNHVPRKLKTKEQASRVAWRIIKDWIEAQIAMVEANQANVTQIFLPYIQNSNGQTLYEALEKDNFKLLTI
jgi:hypothetical protein